MRRPALVNLATHDWPWVTPPELAKHLHCDPRTVLRMIETGALIAYRVGRNWRIPIDQARQKFHVPQTSRNIA